MIRIRPTGCCALKEIDNLSHATTPQNALESLRAVIITGNLDMGSLSDRNLPFFIFSGVTDRVQSDHASSREDNYAETFAMFLVANKLGEVISCGARVNELTGNTVGVWVWKPDWDAVRAYYARTA